MSEKLKKYVEEVQWHPTGEQLLDSALAVSRDRRVEEHAKSCFTCTQLREAFIVFAKVYASDSFRLDVLVADIDEDEVASCTSTVIAEAGKSEAQQDTAISSKPPP